MSKLDRYGDEIDEAADDEEIETPYRCASCDAPLTIVDGRGHVPHLSWCRWGRWKTRHSHPGIVTIPPPATP